MARLVAKSRLDPWTSVDGLTVLVDEVSEKRVDIKITKPNFQIILHMHPAEFERLIRQYEIAKLR